MLTLINSRGLTFIDSRLVFGITQCYDVLLRSSYFTNEKLNKYFKYCRTYMIFLYRILHPL